MPFRITRDNIAKIKADAIVSIENLNSDVQNGMKGVMNRFWDRVRSSKLGKKIEWKPSVKLKTTRSSSSEAGMVIRVSVSRWNGEREILRNCYIRALSVAYENGCRTIAFLYPSPGVHGFSEKEGIRAALEAFTVFLKNHEMEITLVVPFDEKNRLSGDFADGLEIYDEIVWAVYLFEEKGRLYFESEIHRQMSHELCHENKILSVQLHSFPAAQAPSDVPSQAPSLRHEAPRPVDYSLESVLKGIIQEDSFEKHLQKLINKKGLKNSEVYVAANISKQYFSKLMKGQVKPSKEKMLALAVGLRLNLDEMVDFLKMAGYALSPISQTDAIVKHFISHKDYNVMKIDIVLFDFGLEPLSSK